MICPKCSRTVPAGQDWCDACQIPAEFPSRERESMRIDVRARVLWADPVEEIRADWVKKGAPAEEIREAIEEAVRERQRHFRVRGIQDVLIALGCFGLAAGCLYVRNAVVVEGTMVIPGKAFALVLIGIAVLPVAGLWLGLRGARRLLTGGKAEKAASDVSEFDV